ncbi:MAG: DUF169 domain-containing protein [Candidatus Methanoperedens sp.]|nr:DUF169 domain-containing protein [Candidatus Methanoperedens nitroreducens]MDJ1420615.1 DUF169 domain-containing protein [Candidatus Methanoperedens sp.]
MDKGMPVSVLFTEEMGEDTSLLYCELIQRARSGESFLIRDQGCRAGAFVLGDTQISPEDYYYTSKRYRDRDAAKNAVSNLHRIAKKEGSIRIAPYSGRDFDILILFLKPERAMRLVQAFTYEDGSAVELKTGGIASVCSDCTAYPMKGKLGISPGCKGSRKHSRYPDDELVVGIPAQLARRIETALGKIPGTVE